MITLTTTIILSFIGKVLGGFDKLIIMLIIFMIMDYITGIMKAIINKRISSEVGFKGIFKKILILFMIAISHEIDSVFNYVGIRYLIITFYIINEGISIVENASIIGLPIPQKIKATLETLQTNRKWFVFDFKI